MCGPPLDLPPVNHSIPIIRSITQYNLYTYLLKRADSCIRVNYHVHSSALVPNKYVQISRGGEVVSRVAHNHEIAGAIPAPATNRLSMLGADNVSVYNCKS